MLGKTLPNQLSSVPALSAELLTRSAARPGRRGTDGLCLQEAHGLAG